MGGCSSWSGARGGVCGGIIIHPCDPGSGSEQQPSSWRSLNHGCEGNHHTRTAKCCGSREPRGMGRKECGEGLAAQTEKKGQDWSRGRGEDWALGVGWTDGKTVASGLTGCALISTVTGQTERGLMCTGSCHHPGLLLLGGHHPLSAFTLSSCSACSFLRAHGPSFFLRDFHLISWRVFKNYTAYWPLKASLLSERRAT